MTPELDVPERGLSDQEVRQRVQAGLVNEVAHGPSRTVGEIVRANVATRFNVLLGALLLVVLIVLREPRDALFGIVLVTNSGIGIVQELRAKQTLDRLQLLSAPSVRVRRAGRVVEVASDVVVVDDVIEVRSGDQLVVDGSVLESDGLEIDESLLTGESDPVLKRPSDECLSGSHVAAGRGSYRATKVGGNSYAARLAAEAKKFTLARSELREGIDRFLRLVSWAVVPVMGLLVWSAQRGGGSLLEGLGGAVAAGVAMVPQGLVLLTSIAFAVGVVRLGERNVLVQELAAVEGLARVDTVCFDKTGTLTEGRLGVEDTIALSGHDPGPGLAALAAVDDHPNATATALAVAFGPPPPWRVVRSVPFSSARKWSGASFIDGSTWVIGAPEIVAPNDPRAMEVATQASTRGSRVLAVATGKTPLTGSSLPTDLATAAIVVFSDRVRPDAVDTLRFLADQGVRIKVISGDHPETVAAIARQVGIEGASEVIDARNLPEDPAALAAIVERVAVFGRVTPTQKRALVRAMQANGHVVAMAGDGVNDVLALKDSDIGVAIGDAVPASRAVSQLVLLDGRFATIPEIVAEGRRVTSNIERVANLFITSTLYAFGLSVAIVVSALPFPFLPRHLTLVGSLTVGIPAFFLALAPSRRRARPGFAGRVLKFAVPTGLLATLATFAGYWLADQEGSTVQESRTTATLILAAIGLFVLGIVSRPLVAWKKGLLAAMGGLLIVAMLSSRSRQFFELNPPRMVVLLAAIGIVAVTGAVMVLALRAVGWVKVVPEFLRVLPPTQPEMWRQLPGQLAEASGWNRSFPTTTEMQPIVSDMPEDRPDQRADG
jgi:cation-transporting P-type ATPase E